MDALVKNIINAYKVGIDSLEWMSPETKAQAKEKLAHFKVKIGYPDKPRDYSALAIKRDDLFGNAMRVREFQYDGHGVATGQAGRQVALGNDGADGERVVQPDEQRDHLPRRHSAAAVLQRRTPTTR